MSKHTAARNMPPSNAPRPKKKAGRSIGRPKYVVQGAELFVDDGAQAALAYLRQWRKEYLLPVVFLRAKYLARCAKRLAAHSDFLESLRAPKLTGSGLPVPTGPTPIKGI